MPHALKTPRRVLNSLCEAKCEAEAHPMLNESLSEVAQSDTTSAHRVAQRQSLPIG
jgi:hypothetical protein